MRHRHQVQAASAPGQEEKEEEKGTSMFFLTQIPQTTPIQIVIQGRIVIDPSALVAPSESKSRCSRISSPKKAVLEKKKGTSRFFLA